MINTVIRGFGGICLMSVGQDYYWKILYVGGTCKGSWLDEISQNI